MSILKIWTVAAWLHSEASSQIGKEGVLLRGKSGAQYLHPAVSIMNRQAMIMLRAAAEMGFTPSSRSRVSVDSSGEGEDSFDEF